MSEKIRIDPETALIEANALGEYLQNRNLVLMQGFREAKARITELEAQIKALTVPVVDATDNEGEAN